MEPVCFPRQSHLLGFTCKATAQNPRKACQMALIQGLVVEPDGTFRKVEIDNEHLAPYQAIVGGYIEAITGKIATVYVNEEGLILNLPINPSATLFAQRFIAPGHRLFGTALIVGPPSGGLDTPVRQSVVDHYESQED